MKARAGLAALALLLASSPLRADEALARYAYAGVKSFRSGEAMHEFPFDNTGQGGPTYTKPTNIGLDLLSTIAAAERRHETPEAARAHVLKVIEGLEQTRTFRGIFPEYIKLEQGRAFFEEKDGAVRLSSIDSAWLHFALSVAAAHYRKSDPALADRMQAFVDRADYRLFLRNEEKSFGHGLTMRIADEKVLEEWPHNYDNKNSEARVVVVFLVSAGLLPASVWENMWYRYTAVEGIKLAEGYQMNAFVEMTGNAYFDETALAPLTLGRSHRNYLQASQRVARKKKLIVYGWAPCFGPTDRYEEFGLLRPEAASPYAAALLTTLDAGAARENLRRMLALIPETDPPSPYPEALDSETGKIVNARALALDQNLFYHALSKTVLRRLVSKAPWYPGAAELLKRMDQWHTL